MKYLYLTHVDEAHGQFECTGYAEGQACCIDAIRSELREMEDRFSILNNPGTLEAITQGMWDYAESKGHPKSSSSHAYGFLIDLIESQEVRITQLERVHEAAKRMLLGAQFKYAPDLWDALDAALADVGR